MPALSPFKKLPLHIAETIVSYCVSPSYRLREYTNSKDKKTKERWHVLHDVSYSWRILALEYLYGEATLALAAHIDKSEFASTHVSYSITKKRAELVPYVKKVNIVIDDIVDQLNDEKFQTLDQIWPEDLVFPKARSLHFRITNSVKKTVVTRSADEDRYFNWIAQRMRLSLSNLQKAEFWFCYDTKFSTSPQTLLSNEWDAGLFLSILFRKAEFRSYVSCPSYIANERLFEQYIPELSRISSDHPYDNEFSHKIVRKSAATLESLVIEDQGSEIFKHLVYRDDGCWKVYPELTELEILGGSGDDGKIKVDKSIAPFPVLQYLRLYTDYIFSDDTLFRGNSDTLEHLDIELDADTVRMLQKYKVFSKEKYPKLRNLSIQHMPGSHMGFSVKDFIEFVIGIISPATQILSILAKDSYQYLIDAVRSCSYAEDIRIFTLDVTALNLLEMLNIVKLFPNMTDFTCRIREADPELRIMQSRTITDSLYACYYPLNCQLRFWHMRLSPDISTESLAISAIALAVLCPRFIFVNVYFSQTSVYDNELRKALDSGLYDNYADKIRRLLYNE